MAALLLTTLLQGTHSAHCVTLPTQHKSSVVILCRYDFESMAFIICHAMYSVNAGGATWPGPKVWCLALNVPALQCSASVVAGSVTLTDLHVVHQLIINWYNSIKALVISFHSTLYVRLNAVSQWKCLSVTCVGWIAMVRIHTIHIQKVIKSRTACTESGWRTELHSTQVHKCNLRLL